MKRKKKRMALGSAGVFMLVSCATLSMQGHIAQLPDVLKVQASSRGNYEGYFGNDNNLKNDTYSQFKVGEKESSGDYEVEDTNQKKKGISSAKGRNASRIAKNKSFLDIIITIQKSEITSIKNVKAKSVKLKWKKISGVTGYEIYRAKGYTGKYKKIKTIADPNIVSYKNKKLSKDNYYYYKVRAYKVIKGKTFYGEYSSFSCVHITK